MNTLDWIIVAVYMVAMVAMSWFVGRKQGNEKDYYLAGNNMSYWAISLSTMATQCSTNSLLGAPAFVIAVGGLLWLQYELALPLALIGIMALLLPYFRHRSVVSVYEYLEDRFGPRRRTLLSVTFQFLRAFSTGVTVYGISIVIEKLTGLPFAAAVLLLGAITVVYDFLGGIRAVVYSDVIQMVILYTGIAICFGFALNLVGGWDAMWAAFPADKARTLDFSGFGFREGETFTFWPMLIGGVFLYMSYYGCDQTQVQRELSTRNVDDTNMSLFLHGLLRFPLVVTYCLVGVAIATFAIQHPGFLGQLRSAPGEAVNYNLAVPVFCIQHLPHGVIGLIMVSLFAAAMSSLDSTINSLSATTMRDIIERFCVSGQLDGRRALLWSRLTTVFWGGVCVAFSFFVGDISKSIIESINKIGSLANGPILGTFLLAMLTRRTHDRGVVVGIVAGFVANLFTWKFLPQVSWLWWNVSGCAVTMGLGWGASLIIPDAGPTRDIEDLVYQKGGQKLGYRRQWSRYYAILALYSALMLALLWAIPKVLK